MFTLSPASALITITAAQRVREVRIVDIVEGD